MQLKRYTHNSFHSYESLDTSSLDKEEEYQSWDDGVGKGLKKSITQGRSALLRVERELAKYLEDLDNAGAFDNKSVAYTPMTDAIKANTAGDV